MSFVEQGKDAVKRRIDVQYPSSLHPFRDRAMGGRPFVEENVGQVEKGHGRSETPVSEICPHCRGDGWLRSNLPPWHPQYQKVIACSCLLQQRREHVRRQLYALSGLPDQSLLPTLQSFRPHVRGVQQAFRVVKQWMICFRDIQDASLDEHRLALLHQLGWIVLRGPTGVGKTHLAMAASTAALEAGLVTLFATVPDLLDHLRATFALDADATYDALFERMKNAEVLVLDDLGTQKSSPWADEKLFQLFNYRYTYRLPMLVTVNERVWQYVDERLQSRMSDSACVQAVSMNDAQDYRRRQR